MKTFLVFSLALLASPPAFACSCTPEDSYEQQYADATSVTVVRIVSARMGNHTPQALYDEHGEVEIPEAAILATAEVTEQIKGHLENPALVVSPPPDQPCHEAIEVGQTYVVFSSGDWPILHHSCHALPLLRQMPSELLSRWRSR